MYAYTRKKQALDIATANGMKPKTIYILEINLILNQI